MVALRRLDCILWVYIMFLVWEFFLEQQLLNCFFFWEMQVVLKMTLKIVYSSAPEKGPIGGLAHVLLWLLFGCS